MSEKDWFMALRESVGPMAHLPNNGAAFHTGEQIITHLNRTLGPQNWSFHVLDIGQEEDSDECWVYGQITAIIDGVTVVKQDYGSQAMKRARSTGKFVSKWDDKKAAATDALKRCARLLGVGLDAWANEKAPSWRPEDSEPAAPKKAADPKVDAAAQVTGAPTPPTPIGRLCDECHAMVKDESVTILKKKEGPKVTVAIADFEPVCIDRLGAFHCAACYDRKQWGVA